MYLRERLLISLNLQKFFLARSNAKSHSLFIWEVMFNLTFFWVRENSIFLFRTQKSNLLILLGRIIRCVVYNQLMTDAFCLSRVLPWCLLPVVISVNVPPSQQRAKKMSENSISVCKTLLLSLTLI